VVDESVPLRDGAHLSAFMKPAAAGEEGLVLSAEALPDGEVMRPRHRDNLLPRPPFASLADEGVLAMKLSRFVAADKQVMTGQRGRQHHAGENACGRCQSSSAGRAA